MKAGLGTPQWQNLKTVELGADHVRWLRRSYQVVFLGFFLFFVVVTTAGLIRGYDVQWLLEFDPLVALTTALASHSLHHTLLWALILIVITLVLGRVFCAWMCPMGVLHRLWIPSAQAAPA